MKTRLSRLGSGIFTLIISILIIASACTNQKKEDELSKNPNLHKVTVKEILQVTQYTYMLVNENGADHWIAAPKTEAKTGDTFYYLNGMLMTNFASKDLGRTFDNIVFVDKLSTEPITADAGNQQAQQQGGQQMPQSGGMDPSKTPQKPVIEKANVKVDKAPGGISIAELYKNKASYSGKKVIVRGQVTKVNNGIMGTNWVHIQDGTEFEGNVDLTVTAGKEYKLGDVVTFEGNIILDKDYGYGYFYAVIMEGGHEK